MLEAVDLGLHRRCCDLILFGLWALARDPMKVEETAQALNETAKKAAEKSLESEAGQPGTLAGESAQQALAGGLSEYVKALAELAGNVSKLKQGVAGLFIAFALLGLAGGLAAVNDKVGDSDASDHQSAPASGAGSTVSGERAAAKGRCRNKFEQSNKNKRNKRNLKKCLKAANQQPV